MSPKEKILLICNFAIYGLITFFSYSYVDLNLTISQNKFILTFVNFMQKLGYFNRPYATFIYLILIAIAFIFFSYNLWLFSKNKVGLQYLKLSVIMNVLVLIFAYPFLSSDLFNYLFDAKIILNYHANPYTHRPLDFPQDEWLRFMRWVHRYSPYGPLWLGFSLIPAVLGFGKFILNFFTFKIFMGIFHLINSYLIFKILGKIRPKYQLLGTCFYAVNPTLLIEGVVNAHNDVVLATFLIATVYFLVLKKNVFSYIFLVVGTLIKYVPILNLPWLFWATFFKRGNIQKFIVLNLVTMSIFTYVFSSFKISVPFISSGATQVQFQAWYLFWALPLVALVSNLNLIAIGMAVSFGAALRYLPFLYFGDWSHEGTILFMELVTLIPILLSILIFIAKKNRKISR